MPRDLCDASVEEPDGRHAAPAQAGAPPQQPAAAVRTRLRGLRWAARARLSQHAPYLALARARHGSGLATDATELVIDGFPRCGNSFAVVAFQLAQPTPVRVSHHVHSAANIIAAAKRRTPVVVTIRDPKDAVLSCVIREPYVSVQQALTAYIALYERLQPWGHRFVVADFSDITTDMGAVIDRVNDRFDTDFTRFTHVPDNVAQCFGIIEDRARQPPWRDYISRFLSGTVTLAQLGEAAHGSADDRPLQIPEHRVGRPSPERADSKQRLQPAYADPKHARLRTHADQIYQTFSRL